MSEFNLEDFFSNKFNDEEILVFLNKAIDEKSNELGDMHESVITLKAIKSIIIFIQGNFELGIKELSCLFEVTVQNFSILSKSTLFLTKILIFCFRHVNNFDGIISQHRKYIRTLESNLGITHEQVIEQKIVLIEELRGIGQLDDSISIANISIQQLLASEEKPIDLLLQLRVSRAVILSDSGKFDQAIAEFKNIIDESILHFGEMADKTILYKYQLAQTLSDATYYHEAKIIAEEVLLGQTGKLGPNHIETLNTRELIANLLGETGKAEDAVNSLETLIVDIETANETENVLSVDEQNQTQQLARSLLSLGNTNRMVQLLSYAKGNLAHWLGKIDRNEEAIELYQQVLIDLESQFGPDNPKVLTIRSNLASLLKDNSELDESLFMQERILADRIRILGPMHPDVFASRYNLIDTIAELGDLDEALQLFAELIPEVDEALGKGHYLTLLAKEQYAYWLGENEQSDEEIELLRELFGDYREFIGNEKSLDNRTRIAVSIEEAGDGVDAAPYYSQLIEDYENIYGSANINTITIRRRFAYGLYWDEYKSSQLAALRELEIAFHYMESLFGAFDEDTQLVKREIIGLYKRFEGSYWEESSEESWHDNLRELTDRFPTDHPAIQRHKLALALCKFDQGKNQESLESLNQILSEQISQFGASDVRSVRTKEAIVKVLWSMDRQKEAISLLLEVIDNHTTNLGDTNSRTLRAKYELANLYISDQKFKEALPLLENIVNFNAAQNQNISSYDTQDWAGSSFFGSMPEQYDILYELASCYQKMGMSDKAILRIENLINTLNQDDEMKTSYIYTKSKITSSEWKIELLSGEFGASHPRVVDEQLNLARFKLEKPHLVNESIEFLNAILKDLRLEPYPVDSQILEVLGLLLDGFKKNKNNEKIYEVLTEIKNIQINKFGTNSQAVVDSTIEIIDILVLLKKFKFALEQIEMLIMLDLTGAVDINHLEDLIIDIHIKCKSPLERDTSSILQIDQVLLPQGRITEAMMWLRSLVNSDTRKNYQDKVSLDMSSVEILRADQQDSWKQINVEVPIVGEKNKQNLYNKVIKYLSRKDLDVSRDDLSSWPGPSFTKFCTQFRDKFIDVEFDDFDKEIVSIGIFDYLNFVMDYPLGSPDKIPNKLEPYNNLTKEELFPLVDENDPWALKQYGLILDRAGDQDEAVKLWKRAAAMGNPAALRNLGVVAKRKGEYQLAVEFLLKAIEMGSLTSYHALAEVYEKVNEDLVEETYLKGVRVFDIDSMKNLAGYLEGKKRDQEALIYIRMASESGDEFAMLRLAQRLFYKYKKSDESLVWLERAEDNPDADDLESMKALRASLSGN